MFQYDGQADRRCFLAKSGQYLDVPLYQLLVLEEFRRFAEMGVHDRGTNTVCGPQRQAKLPQARLPDTSEGGTERKEPGRVRHNTEAVAVKGYSNCFGINL